VKKDDMGAPCSKLLQFCVNLKLSDVVRVKVKAGLNCGRIGGGYD